MRVRKGDFMKHTIMGFQQKKLIELGLDIEDAAILRYFVDFMSTDLMKAEVVDGQTYYWVMYEGVIAELPMLKMKKQAVRKRFYNLRDSGVLTHYVKKAGGTYSYFGIGERYLELVTSTKVKRSEGKSNKENVQAGKYEIIQDYKEENIEDYNLEIIRVDKYENIEEGRYKNTQDVDIEILKSSDENTHTLVQKYPTNNPSTKRSFINNIEEKNLDQNVKRIVEYLNIKANKNFRTSTQETRKLIKARLIEKFTVEDFEKVIDNMVKKWTGTDWEQYIAPSTLFSGKFDTYLNQGKVKNKMSNIKFMEPSKPIEVFWGEM